MCRPFISARVQVLVQDLRVSPAQVLKAYSHSLDTAAASSEALEDACQPFGGQAPDAVFTCAGASKPMFFVEMDEKDMINGMTNGYWVQAWTAFVSPYSLVSMSWSDIATGCCKENGETT